MREELGSSGARTRISDLLTALELRPNPTLEEEVTRLGLRHRLLTPWTAFVAVDEGDRTDGTSIRVHEPSALPAGIRIPRDVVVPSVRMHRMAGGAAVQDLTAGFDAAPPRQLALEVAEVASMGVPQGRGLAVRAEGKAWP